MRGPFECRRCGAVYYTKRPRGEGEKYCSRPCAFDDLQSWHKVKYRLEPKEATLYPNCEVCGKVAARHGVKTCSAECRRIRTNQVSRNHTIRHDDRDRSPRQCRQCQQVFRPQYGDKHRTFCSDFCKTAHKHVLSLARLKDQAQRRLHRQQRDRRLRGGNLPVEYDPTPIFIRDNWTCQICGENVDRMASVPVHQAPTMIIVYL